MRIKGNQKSIIQQKIQKQQNQRLAKKIQQIKGRKPFFQRSQSQPLLPFIHFSKIIRNNKQKIVYNQNYKIKNRLQDVLNRKPIYYCHQDNKAKTKRKRSHKDKQRNSSRKTFNVIKQADRTIILNPSKPLYSLIWLHGLGDSSAGFFDFFQMKQSPVYKNFRIKLLNAPVRPVTINGGMPCQSWYDIKILSSNLSGSTNQSQRCSIDQVKQSLKTIQKKVQQQAQFLKSQNVEGDVYQKIFVGGFSQGCAMSVLYGLSCQKPIGGVVGLSGYLFQSFDLPNKGKTPILLYHGYHDSVIPFKAAKQSYNKIMDQSNISFKPVDLQHSVNMQQASYMTQWLMNQVNKKN